MKKYESCVCLHCGKKKEEHSPGTGLVRFCPPSPMDGHFDFPEFTDSGLHRVRENAEEVLEAAEELAHLHACEQEGLLSGKPTFAQWCKAVDKLNEAINKAKGVKTPAQE